MSYVSRTLGSKEKVLFLTGYHWLYWLGVAIVTLPFVVLAIGSLPYDGFDYLYLALAILPFLYGFYYFIHGIALEVAVTTDRFVKKTGLVSITSEEVSLDKIEEVNVAEIDPRPHLRLRQRRRARHRRRRHPRQNGHRPRAPAP